MIDERPDPPAAPTPVWERYRVTAEFQQFFHFAHRLLAVGSVTKIKFAPASDRVDLWVLTSREDLQDNQRIYELEREYLNQGAPIALELHIVPLSEIAEHDLPSAELILSK